MKRLESGFAYVEKEDGAMIDSVDRIEMDDVIRNYCGGWQTGSQSGRKREKSGFERGRINGIRRNYGKIRRNRDDDGA